MAFFALPASRQGRKSRGRPKESRLRAWMAPKGQADTSLRDRSTNLVPFYPHSSSDEIIFFWLARGVSRGIWWSPSFLRCAPEAAKNPALLSRLALSSIVTFVRPACLLPARGVLE